MTDRAKKSSGDFTEKWGANNPAFAETGASVDNDSIDELTYLRTLYETPSILACCQHWAMTLWLSWYAKTHHHPRILRAPPLEQAPNG